MLQNNRHSPPLSILIPDGETNFTLPVISCLSQIPGIQIDILSNNRFPPSRFSRHIRNFHYSGAKQNVEEWIAHTQRIADQYTIDIILPVDQPAIRSLAEYKKALDASSLYVAPLPTPKAFDIASNKGRLAQHLQQNGLPLPQTIFYQDEEQLGQELSSLSFPVLIKPVDGKGGQGIEYWDDETKLRKHLEKHEYLNKVIIQSFIKGHFIGCSVLCKEGKILAYTMQIGLLPSRFHFGHAEDIHMIYDKQVFDIVERLIASLQWSGVANIDLYYDEQNKHYKILEINPRYWGTLLGSLNVGVNFPYLACLAGLGQEFPLPTYTSKPYLGGNGIFQLLIPNLLWRSDPSFTINNSAVKYVWADPFPMLARWLIKFFKWVSDQWQKIRE